MGITRTHMASCCVRAGDKEAPAPNTGNLQELIVCGLSAELGEKVGKMK